jgi:hypothetical protein
MELQQERNIIMTEALQVLLPVAGLIVLALASLRFGADSRKLGRKLPHL